MAAWWSKWIVLLALLPEAVRITPAQLPPHHSLTTLSRFFVYAKPDQAPSSWVPSFGWGLWDAPYPLHTRVITEGLSVELPADVAKTYEDEERQLTPVVWIAVMKNGDFWSEFMPYQNQSHFCCRESDVEDGSCTHKFQLKVPPSIRSNVMMAAVATSTVKSMRTDAVFPIHETGVYYLLLVNCMDDPREVRPSFQAAEAPMVGTILIESTHGFLSGVDVPKMNLYFNVAVATAIMALWWMVTTTKALDDEEDEDYIRSVRGTPVVLTGKVHFIHNYMSLTLCLQLLEAVMSYIYYSWGNNSSFGADPVLQFFSVVCSVLKNVTVTTLILAMCLGLYSTCDVMPPNMKAEIWLFGIAFTITDCVKQLANEYKASFDLSPVILLVASLPSTLVAAAGFVWGWKSLANTLQKCRRDPSRLFYKEVMLAKLRRTILVASVLYLLFTVSQVFMYFQDPENIWKYEWIFTDATPAGLFFFVLLCIALIIRPSVQLYQANKLAALNAGDLKDTLRVDTVQIDPRMYESSVTIAQESHGYRSFAV